MFDEIAFRYDWLNQLLSFGIHKGWRKKTIQLLSSSIHSAHSVLLDIATGTGDFALEAMVLNPTKIIGIDISNDMLSIGRKKIQEKNLSGKIELLQADCEQLPFPNQQFNAALVGFGIRNFENLEKGLNEVSRVLKPQGTFAILEFSFPEKFPMKQLYHFYLKNICPLIGKFISKNPVAYEYLFKSVQHFPYGEKLKTILLNSGFSHVRYYSQTGGIVTIYIATK
jgi:demethylmenaquinone methyltransferase / 2-methoxy-6-polyprenyl-1,4-benzoquinol methylase